MVETLDGVHFSGQELGEDLLRSTTLLYHFNGNLNERKGVKVVLYT